jgi:CubicO group peptidase (beta-lactamase class C family)
MNQAALDGFRNYLGGRGFVSRYGYQVYTWGDYTRTADVASASKPVISFFVFKAVEEGRLATLDVKVNTFEPCLDNINANLGFKDRDITFKHMANQISNYGVSEAPGAAFNYSDWQMALLADTLFLKVYQSTYTTVDEQVLKPLLANVLQMQDMPTLQLDFRQGRIQISNRDFARFGLLFLNHGNWNGAQVLSSNHATMAVTQPLSNSIPQSSGVSAEMCPGQRTFGSHHLPDNQTDHEGSYSWLWWTNGVKRNGQRLLPDAPLDTYGAYGHGGPRAMVVMPSLGIVVSWNDANLNTWPQINEGLRQLVSSVENTGQASEANVAQAPAAFSVFIPLVQRNEE